MSDNKIKVHVTEEQRIFLEFLVARFEEDNERARKDRRLRAHNAANLDANCDRNHAMCQDLRYELRQAGT